MRINSKVKMEATPINQAGENIGFAIEVNNNVAVSVVYDYITDTVQTHIFHKDIHDPVATSIFLDLE